MKYIKLFEEFNDDNLNEDIVKAFPELSEDIIDIIALWDETDEGAEETIEKLSVMLDAFDYDTVEDEDEKTVAKYVNMGAKYATTIIYDLVKKKFSVGNIENWIENNQEKYDIK